jgi:hypothetical protein
MIYAITAGSITPINIFWFSEVRTSGEGSSLPVHLISAVMMLAVMTESVAVSHSIASFVDLDFDQSVMQMQIDFRQNILLVRCQPEDS